MNFTIDTNIVFGIVNSKDRIHSQSAELMKKRRKQHLYICHSVSRESKTTLRKNINEIVVEIIRIFPDIYRPGLSSIELQELMIEKFKRLIISKPGKKNFLDWVYLEINQFLISHNKDDLPSFLSDISLALSILIEKKLKEYNYEEIVLNQNNLKDIQKSTAGIYFKDNSDLQIFEELMTNLNRILPIEFILDDAEFKKKCEKGYASIANDLGFEERAFSCILLRD